MIPILILSLCLILALVACAIHDKPLLIIKVEHTTLTPNLGTAPAEQLPEHPEETDSEEDLKGTLSEFISDLQQAFNGLEDTND